MYSFVRDRFMPPNDPLGRDGPCLDDFLRVLKQPVPVIPRQRQGYNFHQKYQPQQQQHYQQQYPQSSGHGPRRQSEECACQPQSRTRFNETY